VHALLAARLVVEVLDRVGEVDRRAVQPGLVDGALQQPAGGSDERQSLPVLLVAGLLSHQQDRWTLRAASGHALRALLPQVTAAARGKNL
jgi:hypothetical protein